MDIEVAKESLDKVINKARIHFYKPIQIAEILYRDRIYNDIDTNKLTTYKNSSKKWRDEISQILIGRICTSSARYQDDVFNDNAIPPEVISKLAEENKEKSGIVEEYIYNSMIKKHSQLIESLSYCKNINYREFILADFLSFFRQDPGLKRSIDKLYEIIVFCLFNILINELKIGIKVSIDESKNDLLCEFEDFTQKVLCINSSNINYISPARIYLVGATNAADRGLDMWSNFGPAIQIKHVSLDPETARNVVQTIDADRIIIVCKDAEEYTISNLINQIGWKAKIQSIITESNLLNWYNKALRGKYSNILGQKLIEAIADEITHEFPFSDINIYNNLFNERGYAKETNDPLWSV